jgi:hypothetical protein
LRKTTGSFPRVCLRKAKRTETTTTISRDSRKTTKKTEELVGYLFMVVEYSRNGGTANKLMAMFVTGEDFREVLKMVDVQRGRKDGLYSRFFDGRTSSRVLSR